MSKKPVLFLLACLLAVSFLLAGCSKDNGTEIASAPPRGVTGTIETGKKVEAAKEKISADGGSIIVDNEDSAIDGLELDVPAGSYPDDIEFKISSAPVEDHTFGDAFNPITPLISIDNGGDFSENIMQITIPVDIPDDQFAMGFIYDDETQTLEGMPLLARDAHSITVGTRHFTDMLISMIPYAKLKKDIDTGFRPGIDDWQFVNYGSYIAPGGHCAGQCLTALWYYINQPDGADLTLYGRYDNNGEKPATLDFWWDDSLGYRFASTVQADIKWTSFANNFWGNLAGVDDQTNYYLFAYSMQVTGEPQEVGIFSSEGGHDMICYRIYQGNLYIADPNYPGNTDRRIEFTDGKFKPYNSAANAAELAAGHNVAYDKIGYCAKTTTIDWKVVEQHWDEFKDGTIGDTVFPDNYVLAYLDKDGKKQGLPEKDEKLVSSQPNIKFAIDSQASNLGLAVFQDGKQINGASSGYKLENGDNVFGLAVLGKINDNWQYIDFRYVTVTYSGVSIEPESQTGEIGDVLSYEAVCDKPPKNARYDWYVDGELQQIDLGPDFQTTFNKAGEYTVTVRMMDENEENVQEAESLTVIQGPTTTTVNALGLLQEFKYLKAGMSGNFLGEFVYPKSSESKSFYNGYEIPSYGWEAAYKSMELEWNGTSFSGSHSNDLETFRISGQAADDGSQINHIEYTYTYRFSDSDGYVTERDVRISLQNIPINESSLYSSDFSYSARGSDFQAILTDFYYHELRTKNGELKEEDTITSPDWTAEGWQKEPHLDFRLFKNQP